MKYEQQYGEGKEIGTPAVFEDYNGNLTVIGWVVLIGVALLFWGMMLGAFMVGTGGF